MSMTGTTGSRRPGSPIRQKVRGRAQPPTTSVNTYDEYGKPSSGNVGRFQYTGQKWIGEIGLYDYKSRMYHPVLGRFMQIDPIGAGMNDYAYVEGDPVNFTDPFGLAGEPNPPSKPPSVVCTGSRIARESCTNSAYTANSL